MYRAEATYNQDMMRIVSFVWYVRWRIMLFTCGVESIFMQPFAMFMRSVCYVGLRHAVHLRYYVALFSQMV